MEATHVTIDFGNLGEEVGDGSTLPPGLYSDPAVYALEREKIFAHAWHAVARADAISRGGYLACEIAGDPVVVTRDEDGALHAFSNVCLHRGCPIARGRGAAERGVLTCPYHRWAYALDGRLRAAPHMERARGFEKGAVRLAQLSVETWHGWVFVNPDPEAAALTPQLSALSERFAPYRIDEMKVCRTLTFESPWNWKIMVENFMESYHHLGAHPETLNARYPAGGTHAEDLPGAFALLENPPKDPADAPFWVACVYPTMLVALTRGEHPTAFWYQMHLHGHDRFTLDIHLLAPAPLADDPQFVARTAAIATAIHLEDIPMCEGVWRGMNSRFAAVGRLSHLEGANFRFYRYLRERLGA
jgi:phenylpropionate dioxygenase-like ring-hydroxylating dioxygenase large terminal subunit